MDNLTHSLVGAILGRAGLKRLTPRAMPALVLSANLPDIDSFVVPLFGIDSLGEHRGFTHGIGGLLIMPFLAAAIIILWEKLRLHKTPILRTSGKIFLPRRGGEGSQRSREAASADTPLPGGDPSRPEAGAAALDQRTGSSLQGLLVCCIIGTLSHPLLDLMNTYGVRLLEPVSHRWFYADSWFIIEPLVWLMLILGLELSWRAERLERDWRRPAWWALGGVLAYAGLNFAITTRAEALARPLVERVTRPRMIVASPPPLEFWKRRIIWRGDGIGGSGRYNLLHGLNAAKLDPEIVPLRLDDPRIAAAARHSAQVRGFLFWSRMPILVEEDGQAYLTDQRFLNRTRDRGQGRGRPSRGTFLIPLDNPEPSS